MPPLQERFRTGVSCEKVTGLVGHLVGLLEARGRLLEPPDDFLGEMVAESLTEPVLFGGVVLVYRQLDGVGDVVDGVFLVVEVSAAHEFLLNPPIPIGNLISTEAVIATDTHTIASLKIPGLGETSTTRTRVPLLNTTYPPFGDGRQS